MCEEGTEEKKQFDFVLCTHLRSVTSEKTVFFIEIEKKIHCNCKLIHVYSILKYVLNAEIGISLNTIKVGAFTSFPSQSCPFLQLIMIVNR